MRLESIIESKLFRLGMSSSTSSHKRSKSFSEKNRLDGDGSDTSPDCSRRKKHGVSSSGKDGGSSLYGKPWPSSGTHSTLKQEISLLEKRLLDQFMVRHALEKALGYRTSFGDNGSDNLSMPKPENELIKEIASLELEVAYLEQYLLTLYRKAFDHQVSAASPQSANHFSIMDKNPLTPADSSRRRFHEVLTPDASTAMKRDCLIMQSPCMLGSGRRVEGKSLDSGVERCHSSLAQCSAPLMARRSPPEDSSLRAGHACRSQPLSMLEESNIPRH
ncbi:hypothetical protein MLD38_030890 [Melastoma candidum]|uniref:Uncharacterized protein n=1 Tax=Melastoma candidum TaxID=119954 RepID=A0ACB9MN26_9MYRT|nr:hypothetical protein MLD38_030890 [Melastoma candidum]